MKDLKKRRRKKAKDGEVNPSFALFLRRLSLINDSLSDKMDT